MKRVVWRAVGAVCALAFLTPVQALETIKIGDINSYNRLPARTVPYIKGVKLALEEINASGGVLGRQLELISRDDHGKPEEAIKIAEELFDREGVALVAGSLFSDVGLALASYAAEKKRLYLAADPLTDALVWAKGNRYTFRLRPSTYMQAAMLAEEAAKSGAKRWATIAPDHAFGKDAVASFKKILKAKVPDVEFVAEQWPALFKIKAAEEVEAIAAAKPDAIYNVIFGSDLVKFVRAGKIQGLFEKRLVIGLLTGEPEYLDPLRDEAPEGWIVTGYPWGTIKDPTHVAFVTAYRKRWRDYPRLSSIVGYNTMLTIRAALERAGKTDTESLVAAMKGLTLDTPTGSITFRAIDHQSTMGAYVGKTALEYGTGVMVDWTYKNGADYLPSNEEVKALRPATN